MEKRPGDEGKVIKKNIEHASRQDPEATGLKAESANTYVPTAAEALSTAPSASSARDQTPAWSEGVGPAGSSHHAGRHSYHTTPHTADLHQTLDLQPSHESSGQSSRVQAADSEGQRYQQPSEVPQGETSSQRDPSQVPASVWLPQLTAVVDQQTQQQSAPDQGSSSPPQQSQQFELSPEHQQQQPTSHPSFSHTASSLAVSAALFPEQLQQQQYAPSHPQQHLPGPPTASSIDQLEQAGSTQTRLQGRHEDWNGIPAALQRSQVGLQGGQAGFQGAQAEPRGGSGSSQPKQRDAAAQTHSQLRQHQLQASDQQAISGATSSGGEISGDDSSDKAGESRVAKKPRLVWTSELHARFMNAVNHLGVKNAVPKTILQLMNVDGMTRENVASHLQKYRLYLKKLGGYPANAKTSPEALQQVQQQALQQQAHEALQANLSAMQGLPSHNTNQGYFGPSSLYYTPSGGAAQEGYPQSGQGFQPQGPQGPSAAPSGWFPTPGNANQAFDNQQGPALQQMASAYGLLPRGQQAAGQGTSGQAHAMHQQQPWSWGQGSSQSWGIEGGAGQFSHHRQLQSYGPTGHTGDKQHFEEDFAPGPSRGRHSPTSQQVPDALAHLLSAAEAASSAKK